MKIRKLIEEDGRKLAKIFDEQILATIDTNTLDEQMLEILNKLAFSGAGMHDKKGWTVFPLAVETAKQQLKTLFTEHSKEVDRLARIDELSKIHTVFYDGNFSSIKDRLTQLKRNK